MRSLICFALALAALTFWTAAAHATVIEDIVDPSPESSPFTPAGGAADDASPLPYTTGTLTLTDARFGATPTTSPSAMLSWLVVGDVNLARFSRGLTSAPAAAEPAPAVRSTSAAPTRAPLLAAIVAIVPEPTAAGLLASGILGLFFVGRVRR